MKLYHFPGAPNPTRVLLFAREKASEIEEVVVSLIEGEQNRPEHLARNPRGALPVLELDSGEFITESVPIMEYLEEIQPNPVLIGSDPLSRLRMRMLERRVEKELLDPIGRLVHATNSPLGRPPVPQIAERERERLPAAFADMDKLIGDHPFVTGDSVSVVDCTLFAALFFGELFGVETPQECRNIHRWYASFKQRPSAQF